MEWSSCPGDEFTFSILDSLPISMKRLKKIRRATQRYLKDFLVELHLKKE